MGNLTCYLQNAFADACPDGWSCRPEVSLVGKEIASLLGYHPRADLVLERKDGSRRLWIEFEVSRADPVANEAKFATAHLFEPRLEADAFLAMVSPHVTRGRRNLGAATIALLRRVGIQAYQTTLLPHLTGAEIQRLNQSSPKILAGSGLDVRPEIERALLVSTPVAEPRDGSSLHFAGDLLDVMLNLWRWNQDVATPEGANLWATRTVTFFVFDPRSRHFAPSKFCAYVPIRQSCTPSELSTPTGMTVEAYAKLDGEEPRFDGHRARHHLVDGLAMIEHEATSAPDIAEAFAGWHRAHASLIRVHPKGPIFLSPPVWFA